MSKDKPQFNQSSVVSDNGAGVPLVEGSPSTSIALEGHTEPAATFGYNSKDPAAIRSEHQRNQRYERGGF